MDSDYLQRLRADADAGNRIAERLLLLTFAGEENRDELEALLDRCPDTNHRHFLQAELQCFHGWPEDEPWQELLRAAADSGHAEAQGAVTVLDAWGWDDWAPPGWQTVVSGKGLSLDRSERFAPPVLVNFLRNLLGPQLKPSAVIDPDSGRAVAHPVRINRCAQWYPEHLGWIGKLFETRLAVTAGYDVSCGEAPSLLHYTPGQRYKAHLDCIGRKQAESEEGRAQGGQRVMTVLLALGNDDYEGGETWFPHLEAGTKSATGELLRFNNTDAEGKPLPSSLHAGQPVTASEKWLLSKWVREQKTPYGAEISLDADFS